MYYMPLHWPFKMAKLCEFHLNKFKHGFCFPSNLFFLIYKANPFFLIENNRVQRSYYLSNHSLIYGLPSYFQLLATLRLEQCPQMCVFSLLQDTLPEIEPTYVDISDYFLERLQQLTLSNLCVVYIFIFADLNGLKKNWLTCCCFNLHFPSSPVGHLVVLAV